MITTESDAGIIVFYEVRRESRYPVSAAFHSVAYKIGLRVTIGELVDKLYSIDVGFDGKLDESVNLRCTLALGEGGLSDASKEVFCGRWVNLFGCVICHILRETRHILLSV